MDACWIALIIFGCVCSKQEESIETACKHLHAIIFLRKIS